MMDQEREAHRDEVIAKAREVVAEQLRNGGTFGSSAPIIRLHDELRALDDYDARHREGAA